MRLNKLNINGYGPLNREYEFEKGFNLLMGDNERGKTLTIDALVKLLFKKQKDRKIFNYTDRVGEDPDGSAVMLIRGQELTLRSAGNLSDRIELSPRECRNIFIVKNSDLLISEEDSFYNEITDRLTGLRTNDIKQIKKKLLEKGRLTDTLNFKNTDSDNKLKTRIERAKENIQSIKNLQGSANEHGYNRLEEDLIELEEKKERIKQELEELDTARKRKDYERFSVHLQSLQQAKNELKKLSPFEDKDRQTWRDNEKEVQRLDGEIENKQADVGKREKKLEELSGELEQKNKTLNTLESQKKDLESNVDGYISQCSRIKENIEERQEKNRKLAPVAYVSSALLGISIMAAALNPSWWTLVLTGIFLLVSAWLWWPRILLSKDQGDSAKLLEKANQTLAKYGLAAEDLWTAIANVNSLKKEHDAIKEEVDNLAAKRTSLQQIISNIKGEISKLNENRQKAQEEVNKIKNKSNASVLQEYEEKLESKKKVEADLNHHKKSLAARFASNEEDLEKQEVFWSEQVSELEQYKDSVPHIEYDEKKENALKQEDGEVGRSLEEQRKKLTAFKETLADLEKEVDAILTPEKDFPDGVRCRSFVELETAKEKLDRFVKSCKGTRKKIRKAFEILEEIDAEEKDKISELFGEDSAVSRHMKRITDGLYSCVSFDGKGVICHRRDDIKLKPEKLSGGAYDQLYFSIRLALGERLLQGEKGFFVLDDPFLKADYHRLEQQLDILKEIAREGWQLIYFSSKKEVFDLLEGDIIRGDVSYQAIPELFGP